jgi:hypothetical protein
LDSGEQRKRKDNAEFAESAEKEPRQDENNGEPEKLPENRRLEAGATRKNLAAYKIVRTLQVD